MAVGVSNFSVLYQTFYPDTDLPYLVPENLPFWNLLPKEDGLSGQTIDHPWLYGTKQGFSLSFDAAQAQAGNAPNGLRAVVSASQGYQVLEFNDKDEVLSQGEAAYADLFQKTMTGAFKDFYNRLDIQAHIGNSALAQVVAVSGGVVNGITLVANQIAVNTFGAAGVGGFSPETWAEVGMQLQASTTAPTDGTVPSVTGNIATVTAVDAVNRIITLSDASAFTTSNYIYQRGNALGFSSANFLGGIVGMDNWVPMTAPTSADNFLGVNRSVYGSRLSGYRYTGTSRSIEDAIKRLGALMSQGGAMNATVCLLNPLDFDALDSKMTTFNRYSSFSTATYGFDSIVVSTAAGRVDCLPDPHMAQGFARLITPDSWLFRHKLQVPHIVDIQGRTAEQALNFDGRTARMRFYGQLLCLRPHENGIVALPQVAI